jgi:hypothetical protein
MKLFWKTGCTMLLIALLSAPASWADSAFTSRICYADKSTSYGRMTESFFIRFETTNGSVRTLFVTSSDFSVRFSGATLAEFKWAVDYADVRRIRVDRDSVLTIFFHSGFSRLAGKLTEDCLKKLRAFDSGGLEISIANTAD